MGPFKVLSTRHIGFAVSILERSLDFVAAAGARAVNMRDADRIQIEFIQMARASS